MNETNKIAEACHFYSEMRGSLGRLTLFQFNLSAFLSSARSVLQYALEEAKTKPGGQTWYENWAQCPEIKYFKDKRDTNIHVEPVVPARRLHVVDKIAVGTTLVGIRIVEADGTVHEGTTDQVEVAPTLNEPDDLAALIVYRFSDWQGQEDVLALCEKLLGIVVKMVAEGKTKRFLV